ncbi:MAG: hypothetical protein KF893_24380 [Caldilineaceae bacterium]|nr:hypothetical protein [Caldilineaceae bacterium]
MLTTELQTRTMLADVPRVGFDVHLCPFPGSLYACLAYLNDPCDYDYVMGVTGAAFRRLWNRDDGGNIDLSYLGETPLRRVFEALGYTCRVIPAEKEAMVQAIEESIGRGKPVIAFGILGPPEAGIVAGYAQAGEILYGWSYFQEYFQQPRDRYYESSDWFERMDKNAGKGLIVIDEKLPTRPPVREVLIKSLSWAIELARQPQRPGLPDHVSGLAAYDAWAAALEVDADYPPDDSKVLETRVMVHGDQATMLEERHAAARFLRQMADAAPEVADPLNRAADLYTEVANFVPKVWLWGASMGSDAQQGLIPAQTRRTFATYIRKAREREALAVDSLGEALAALSRG